MKRILLLHVFLSFLGISHGFGQAVYYIYAAEPSGVRISPSQGSKPNTATVKSGQSIILTGHYDQGVALWYGDGLPANGAVFGTKVLLTNTGTESITKKFQVNSPTIPNNNYITVTILPQQGTPEPIVSTSTYCTANPTLTATGCAGTVKWYKLIYHQFSGLVDGKTIVSGAEGSPTFQPTESGAYCATCTVAGVESFGNEVINVNSSTGVQPYIFLSSPHRTETDPPSNSKICMWSDYSLTASGLGLEAGTVTWHEKIGNGAVTEIGTGATKNVEITNLNTQYYAQLAVPGCAAKTSFTHTFTVQTPSTIVTTAAERHFKVHSEGVWDAITGLNILADDNCQIIAGFIPGYNNDEVNVMLGKMMTAKVSLDNSVKLYNNQPYLQRHFDFEPDNIAEAQNAWYSVIMYFTQADFDAFNAVSSVKLPSNSTPEEQSKLTNLRIWQVHGTPLTIPATPANYSGGPATDYGCVACRSSNWNEAKNRWEVHLNTNGFSGFFITTEGATALPVTLINFKAQKQENAVALTWQTTEETNSDRFEIEHSVNSKQWVNIGSVVSHRESNSLKNYTHTHLTPVTGENLYRLKMIDRATDRQDGSFAYSRIVSIKMDARSDISLYPNPGYENVTVTSKIPVSAYKLVSATGQVIKEKQEQNQSLIHVPLAKVPPGIYVMQLSLQNGQVEYRKLVVQ